VWSVRSAWFQPPCPRRVPQLASTLGAPCVAANPQSPLPRKTRSSPPPRPAGRPSRRILALDCASCGANGRMTRIVRPLVRASLCISSLCKPAELFVVVTKNVALPNRTAKTSTTGTHRYAWFSLLGDRAGYSEGRYTRLFHARPRDFFSPMKLTPILPLVEAQQTNWTKVSSTLQLPPKTFYAEEQEHLSTKEN